MSTPTDFFTGYDLETVETVQGVFIPLSTLTGLTAAEAHPTTGNGAEVVRCIVLAAKAKLDAMTTKPTNTNITSTMATLSATGRRQDLTLSFTGTIPDSAFNINAEA